MDVKNKEEIFNRLYQEYWDTIFRLSMGYVNDSAWAKDIAQEMFVNVWNNLSSFRNESSYSTWIYRIAVNLCLRQLSRNKKFVANEHLINHNQADSTDTYEEKNVDTLYKAISELSEMNRIIISLSLEGLEQKEIANIVGLTHANIRTRVHRIKEELYTKLK